MKIASTKIKYDNSPFTHQEFIANWCEKTTCIQNPKTIKLSFHPHWTPRYWPSTVCCPYRTTPTASLPTTTTATTSNRSLHNGKRTSHEHHMLQLCLMLRRSHTVHHCFFCDQAFYQDHRKTQAPKLSLSFSPLSSCFFFSTGVWCIVCTSRHGTNSFTLHRLWSGYHLATINTWTRQCEWKNNKHLYSWQSWRLDFGVGCNINRA